MKWALQKEERIEPIPNQEASCPICLNPVISKCGSINIWHWSHKNLEDCDDWYEPESQWHKDWKNEFPKEQQEFTMGKHRADIRTSNRVIIELQNSPISSENIIDREDYYKRMIWLLNGANLAKGLKLRNKKDLITFRWKHPPKTWWSAEKEVYIDLSELYKDVEIFLIKKVYNKIPCGGWGIILSRKQFLDKFRKKEEVIKDGESRAII